MVMSENDLFQCPTVPPALRIDYGTYGPLLQTAPLHTKQIISLLFSHTGDLKNVPSLYFSKI
jgi:hypothetical protein